jgi:hypothetical protein
MKKTYQLNISELQLELLRDDVIESHLERLNEIKQSLQSSISYAGGKDLNSFNLVEFITVN